MVAKHAIVEYGDDVLDRVGANAIFESASQLNLKHFLLLDALYHLGVQSEHDFNDEALQRVPVRLVGVVRVEEGEQVLEVVRPDVAVSLDDLDPHL